ncbi:unannotated protein [freshwater metagenome]|uniref:Unannotated protein n=1 Tax=freshwater metagenome TaxID=449393 RepID=A0A6J7KFW1_9ZZZZ
MLGERDAERAGVLERASHELRVLHAVAVIGKDAHTRCGELTERGEPLASAADGDAARRQHLAQPGALALGAHELDDGDAVLRRVGVRHRHHRSEATERSAAAAGLDGLGFFLARLAEVHVQVDETGGDDAARGVEELAAGEPGSHLDDVTVLDGNVASTFTGLVEQRSARNDHSASCGGSHDRVSDRRSPPVPSSENRTAIRTATPLVTWSRMAEPGRSAGSTTISTPRFIGPGCITSA